VVVELDALLDDAPDPLLVADALLLPDTFSIEALPQPRAEARATRTMAPNQRAPPPP